MQPEPESELVRELIAGREGAFDRFYLEFAPRLYRFILPRLNGDQMTAEEICQEVLINAMRKIETWRGEAALFTWLCQMARNELTDHWRRRQRRAQMEVLIEDEPSIAAALESIEGAEVERPDRMHERSELIRLVMVALDRMPSRYGQALEWKYIDGDSVQDIASRMGQTAIATQSLLARARTAFRDALTTLTGRELRDLVPFATEESRHD